MRETAIIIAKKAESRLRLIERYYGKKDILASWEQCPIYSCARMLRLAPQPDLNYVRDLARRVHGHQNDLAYRGVDTFTEILFGSADHHGAPL